MKKSFGMISLIALLSTILSGCSPSNTTTPNALRVLAVESFLADITQNVAGNVLTVESLIPVGLDLHNFEPIPEDLTRISDADVLVINGGGLETWLEPILQTSEIRAQVIDSSAGLTVRTPSAMEESPHGEDHDHHEGDPHFWLDPILVIQYVENIRDGLSEADPQHADAFAANADAYIARLTDLNTWIQEQVAQIPANQRFLVGNHEEFGYFADQYGFQIIGSIIPSVTTGSSPSAQQMALLINAINQYHVRVIFLEIEENPQLADQIAAETGVQIVTDLYTHSLSDPSGPAPTYLDMMRYNTTIIVDALTEN